jgi:hypothetical protein
MPTGVRTRAASQPLFGWTSALEGSLPFGQLLRADGGERPLSTARARRRLVGDVTVVRAVLMQGGAPEAWRAAGFCGRVEAARRDLAPIASSGLLVESFRREAFHGEPGGAAADAVRVAYAIRWLEVVLKLDVPPWGRGGP